MGVLWVQCGFCVGAPMQPRNMRTAHKAVFEWAAPGVTRELEEGYFPRRQLEPIANTRLGFYQAHAEARLSVIE